MKVSVNTGMASATLSKKGSIHLLNRQGSNMIYKFKPKNFTDEIADVTLSGSYAGFFNVIYDQDKKQATLTAVPGKPLAMNTTYELTFMVEFANGMVMPVKDKMKCRQTVPGVKGVPAKLTMYESVYGEQYGEVIEFQNNCKFQTTIEKVELVDGKKACLYNQEKSILYVDKQASAKAKSSYPVKFQIYYEDMATNAKPVYATVRVNYQK